MEWEDVWRMTIVAANSKIEEINAEYRFHFSLHTDKNAKWEDLPLPFENPSGKKIDAGGISQLPDHLRNSVVRSSLLDNK